MAIVPEALRRAYRELVRRRARLEIQPARPVELAAPPIFVLGLHRSGTTLLRYVLDSHSRIACPPESEFLGCLAPLVRDRRPSRGLGCMGFDEEHVRGRLRELAQYFFGNYAAARGKVRWADKSPSYVEHRELVRELFPESRFVVLHRHGLDQAHSFTRGGERMRDELADFCRPGEDLRIGAVRYWCRRTEELTAFVASAGEAAHVLRYEDLCADPAARLEALFAFLDEPWEPEVLEFHRFDHDPGFEDGRIVATSGFEPARAHWRGWPGELLAQCAPIAAPALAALGYPEPSPGG